jgi:signal transduction histidine kinase
MKSKQSTAERSSNKPFFNSLRVKVTAAVFFPLLFILGTFMVMQYQIQQKMLMNNLSVLASQTALTIENSLQQAMLNHNRLELQNILDSIGQNSMLGDIYLMDLAGTVVFSPNNKQVGTVLTNQDAACQACHRLSPENRPASQMISLANGQRFFRSMNPIRNKPECQSCHAAAQRNIGVLMTDISIEPLEASLRFDFWQHLILWSAAVLVSVVVVNVAVSRFVFRRLEALAAAIKKLGRGQHASLLPENQSDEIGQVSLAFNEMARQIDTRESENRELSETLDRRSKERGELLKRLITAQEDERMRIARELHDELGQALAVLALQTELAHKSVLKKPERTLQILDQIQTLVGETSEQMYNMILALRPSVLDDLGLAVALRSHADRVLGDSGIIFQLDARRLPRRLSPDLEIVLYRVFQEALTNIFRHARASNVTIRLAQEEGCFVGEIEDDGQGFDRSEVPDNPENSHGLGLAGMQERVLQHNGLFEVFSQPGQGTKIKIRIPIQEMIND